VKKTFTRSAGADVETKEIEVELFTWEKLDYVDALKSSFGI
jgi:S-adenosylmethionine synthetase